MSVRSNAASDVVISDEAASAAPERSQQQMAARMARSFAPAAAIVVAQQVLFPTPAGIFVRGLIIGGLTALIALGMALVYRANRIINFAQADLGFAPTILTFLLLTESGVPYPLAVLAGLATAVLLGAATERLVIRRFARAPRLLVTIATVGLSQVLAAAALLVPDLWDLDIVTGRVDPPFDLSWQLGVLAFDANDLLALVVTPLAVALVALLLQRSDAGVAIRASADDADRAALLGIPVDRLQTVVWSLAAALAFVAVFLRSGILDLPSGTALGFSVLLRALVALLLGRMTDLVAVTSSAVALGALELGIDWNHDTALIEPVLGVVVVVALLARRHEVGRIDTAESAAWRAADEVRRVPAALARLPEVRTARIVVALVLGAVALALPLVLSTDQVFKASALAIYAILGVSLVILSGWGGTVSLGQVAFFALGAAVGGAVVSEWGVDLYVALLLAAVAGAAAAALVGVPTLRLRGLYLAVTTFAFALAATSWLLDPDTFGWVPSERIERAPFLGGIGATSETGVYYLALAFLVLVALGARGIRTGRFGRALVALRDDERAAQAYAVDAVRTQLVAFALSGAVAALAGALFVHHERAFDTASYSPLENLAVFTMVVVGGMATLAGAVLGALFLLGARWFLSSEWQFLASGLGVLLILLLAPGGLASLVYRVRDAWLRGVAARHGLPGPGAAESDAEPRAGGPGAGGELAGGGGPGAGGTTAEGDGPPSGGPLGEGPSGDGPRGDGAPGDDLPASPSPGTGETEPPSDGDGDGDLLLDVRDLKVGYGGVPVLFGVDLRVRRGEAVALLGTNGAGKSTLLRAVSGLLPPDEGSVVLDGADVTGRPPHVIAARGVAQMPGGAGVFPTLSVAENLRVAGWLRRSDRAALGAAVDRARHMFPVLAERADDPAGHLSGGQQQMLALAMSVLSQPRLLMIDELSLGLAPAVVGQLLRFVDQLRAEGTTVVVVEQSVNVALDVADRAVFLERGTVRFSGAARDLLDRPDLLRSVFLAPAAGDAAPGPAVPTAGAAAVAAPDAGAEPAAGDGHGEPAAALRAVGVAATFGGVHAVDDVSLDVGPGEIVGVIGPNGAGKTTLFDVLSGFVPTEGGRILLGGHDVTRLSPAARAHAGLGRSFQSARLFGSLTVDETIAVAHERWVAVGDPLSSAFHLPGAVTSEHDVARRVDALVELLGLGRYRSLFVAELSTGTRRVVDLACLLAFRPRVVLLDEPAAGLAQREVEQLAPLIARIRDEADASVVVVEHDIPLVEAVADRLVAMDRGRVVATGPPAEVLSDPAVLDAYLGGDRAAIQRSGGLTP